MNALRRQTVLSQLSILGIVLLIIAVAVAWFLCTYERVEETVGRDYSGEALYNRFYAAEKLLQNVGRDSDSRATLVPDRWLPPPADTLVTPLTPTIDTAEQSGFLLQWVENGGHLLLLPRPYTYEESVLLDSIGFTFEEVPAALEDAEEQSDDAATVDESEPGETDTAFAPTDFVPTVWRLTSLDDTLPEERLEDESGIYAARLSWGNGEGVITLVAPDIDFTNWSLQDSGSGQILLNLVDGEFEPGKTWFIYSSRFPSLIELVIVAFPLTVAALTLLFALWLWSILPRFGPAIVEQRSERRSLGEHIEAAGRFSWRRGEGTSLAHAARDALLHDAEIRHPGIGRLTPEKQAQRLASIAGMEATAVYDALYLDNDERARDFTERLKTLQILREHL